MHIIFMVSLWTGFHFTSTASLICSPEKPAQLYLFWKIFTIKMPPNCDQFKSQWCCKKPSKIRQISLLYFLLSLLIFLLRLLLCRRFRLLQRLRRRRLLRRRFRRLYRRPTERNWRLLRLLCKQAVEISVISFYFKPKWGMKESG